MPPRGTLKVIDAAEDFAVEVNLVFSRGRRKTFASQICNSAGSISGNLIEGYDRGRGADRMRLYRYAKSSCEESLGWLRKSFRLAEIDRRDYYRLRNRGIAIARMIQRLKY